MWKYCVETMEYLPFLQTNTQFESIFTIFMRYSCSFTATQRGLNKKLNVCFLLPFLFALSFFLTQVLQFLVVLSGFHVQVEFVLGRALVQQILAGLLTVCLKQMFDPV